MAKENNFNIPTVENAWCGPTKSPEIVLNGNDKRCLNLSRVQYVIRFAASR